MSVQLPIPAYPGYTITPEGCVFYKDKLKTPIRKTGRSIKIRITTNGITKELGLAKLLAEIFLPNPNGYSRIIFKDGNHHNCVLENIQWVSDEQYVRHTLFPGKPLAIESKPFQPNPSTPQVSLPNAELITINETDPDASPIPGYPGYFITPDAKVYHNNRLLPLHKSPNRAARVNLRNEQGKRIRLAVAKLLALAFIPNLKNHSRIIFKDRDQNNCSIKNIQWVSHADWIRFVSRSVENADLLGQPKPQKQKQKPYVWIDPQRIEISGFLGYYISPAGIVYRGNRIIKPNIHKGHAPILRIRIKGTARYFGLATLVAEHFVSNPGHHRHIIFKDRNNQNCSASNLAWVDQETYTYYCTAHKGVKKLYIDRNEAIRQCRDEYLKMYYKTLDEYWLHECWKQVETQIQVYDWHEFRSDCYLYFLDRAKRFSILRNPVGLLAIYVKGLREKLRKEISPDMPRKVLVCSDESLRYADSYD